MNLVLRRLFRCTPSDVMILQSLGEVDRAIMKGISDVERHIEKFGAASDRTRIRLNNHIHNNQSNEKNLYWCYGKGQP
jgi:hypothetical protein